MNLELTNMPQSFKETTGFKSDIFTTEQPTVSKVIVVRTDGSMPFLTIRGGFKFRTKSLF